MPACPLLPQVSELSHRLGSAEGSNKALEEEVTRLRSEAIAAAQERAQREAAAAELKSKLLALEEKVSMAGEHGEWQEWQHGGWRKTMHRMGCMKMAIHRRL
jgi:hypothetical protein